MSGTHRIYPDPIALAHTIKDRIRNEFGFIFFDIAYFWRKNLFRGTFVEAIDKGFLLCYTKIIIDFCAPSDWDS